MPSPNWLTHWVTINSKHVSHVDNFSHEFIAKGDKQTHRSVSTASTATDASEYEDDDDTLVPKVTRKTRRRLTRTYSASDLIRNEAKGLKSNVKATRNKQDVERRIEKQLQAANIQYPAVEDDGINSTRSSASVSAPPSSNCNGNRFLNETTFIQQLEQKQQRVNHNSALLAIMKEKRPAQNVTFADPITAPPHLSLSNSRSPSNSPPRSSSIKQPLLKGDLADFMPQNHFVQREPQQGCIGCQTFQRNLHAAYDDLEYLRTLLIQTEYSADKPVASKPQLHTEPMEEITKRHRKQIEQLMKERVSFVFVNHCAV
jgi:hypothetical protein